MKKRLMAMLVVALGLTAAMGVFAEGQREAPYGPGWRGQSLQEAEKLTLTGELYFQNRIHPELKSGGEEYELLVPRYYTYGADLKEGQTITVEGYKVDWEMPCEGDEEGEAHLWVTKATIDGKEYDLERYGPRYGMMGGWGGHGMMGGWGPRRGW